LKEFQHAFFVQTQLQFRTRLGQVGEGDFAPLVGQLGKAFANAQAVEAQHSCQQLGALWL